MVEALSSTEKLFTLRTDNGVHYSRTVVLAVGPGNKPRIPQIPGITRESGALPPQVCHSMQIKEFPAAVVQSRIDARKATNVLMVGGGLTSAQLTDLAIRKGVTKVWHFMRGPCKVKLFDVDLTWMGKFRNVEQAYFHGADTDADRLQHILDARNGGSLTPTYHKILKRHIAAGKAELKLWTSISSAEFDEEKGLWTVQAEPAIEGLPKFDYIYFATGIQSDFYALPYLQRMLKEYPIVGHGGLPCLTEDLKWHPDVPFFVAGRFAGLRLGPAAGNLGGARIGAERIAWAIEDALPREDEAGDDKTDEALHYVTGRGNRFRSLPIPSANE